jgi:hypothetical protein
MNIYHVADIHINESNRAHIERAWSGFLVDICADKSPKVVAICGDVFDKHVISATDIKLFGSMMSALESAKVRTVMMPGNHDINNNQLDHDIIGAIMTTANFDYITHHTKSCVVEVEATPRNIKFHIHSPVDGGMPRPENGDSVNVAMLHEQMNGYTSSNGAAMSGFRFSPSDFSDTFDMTMLGDIHNAQFLAPNVAYSGSLVQKTRGEGLEHGYILWDTTTFRGEHKWLPQLSLHVKVRADNDKLSTPLPTVEAARSLSLYHTKCGKPFLTKLKRDIVKHYGRPIDSVYDQNVCAISIAPDKSMSEVGAVIKIVGAHLDDMKADPDTKARVLKLHNEYFEAAPDIKPKDWHLVSLAWSNIYCYGTNNHINFGDLGKMTSIIGANKIGKSSIIDILVLALFNDTVRGSIKQVINVSADSGHIKCVFKVAGVYHEVERVWLKNKATAKVRFYIGGVNKTAEDVVKTYAAITDIIGSRRIFINSAAALQHRQFLTDIGSRERYELISRMIDLDRMRAAEDANNSELLLVRRQRTALLKQLDKTADDKLEAALIVAAELDAEIGGMRATITHIADRSNVVREEVVALDYTVNEVRGKLRKIGTSTPHDQGKYDSLEMAADKLGRSIDFVTATIGAIQDNRAVLKSQLIKVAGSANATALKSKMDQIGSINIAAEHAALAKLNQKFGALTSSIAAIDLATLKSKVPARNPRSLEVIQLELAKDFTSQISECEGHIADLKLGIKQDEIRRLDFEARVGDGDTEKVHQGDTIESATATIAMFTKEVGAAIKSRDTARARKRELEHEITTKTKYIAAYSEFNSMCGKMTWEKSCGYCESNKHVFLDTPNQDTEKNELDNLATAHKSTSARLVEMENNVDRLNATIIQTERQCRSLYLREIKAIDAATENSTSIITGFETEIKDAKEDHAAILLELDAAKSGAANKYSTALADHTALTKDAAAIKAQIKDGESRIDIFHQADRLRDRIQTITTNDKTNECIAAADAKIAAAEVRRLKMVGEMGTIQATMKRMGINKERGVSSHKYNTMLDIAIGSEAAIEEIADGNKKSARLNLAIGKLESKLSELELGTLRLRAETMRNIIENIATLDATIVIHMKYASIINHKNGIPRGMMSNTCATIQRECNQVFSQVADFSIRITFDKEISIETEQDGAVVDAEQSSGYQKFIIDLIMRQVLCSLTSSSYPRMLFIDEGFGSLDAANFSMVCSDVLPMLSDRFEKVLVISHINGINEATEDNIVISKSGAFSVVRHGAVINASIKLLADLESDEKSEAGEKAARKEAAKLKRVATRKAKSAEKKLAKDAEFKSREMRSIELGQSVIVKGSDAGTITCTKCDKTFKNTATAARSHIKTKRHINNV